MQANQSTTESGQLEKLEELTEEMTESDLSSVLNKSKENGSSMVDLHNQSLYSKEASISKNIKDQQQSTVEGGPPSLRKKKVSFQEDDFVMVKNQQSQAISSNKQQSKKQEKREQTMQQIERVKR